MTAVERLQSLVLPLALMASLLVILVPLPSAVIDVLLTINIAVSVLVLLTTLFINSPLEFSVFPTVLLAATIGRLVLNVATTRLILTAGGESGLAAAGGVVEGFGSFVAGNQIVVGLIIFAIIVLIQFVVVTKGATRISEVSARFALDGMPGKQMAIDADVNAGVIDQAEARQQRMALTRNAEFYGAMDGASKFVRGDAIVGIAITLLNIVGGLFVGVTQYGMSLTEAVNVFTRLTIGDGLVSQLPAFLIALAAGLLVTRSAERINLPVEFLRQLFLRPEALVVAAAFLGVLVFTRLPTIPLLLVGGGFAGVAMLLTRSPQLFEAASSEAIATEPAKTNVERRVEDLLAIDPVELELAVGLLRLADPQRGGNLLARISTLRQRVALDLGMVLPRVRIRDNMGLEEYGYRFKIFGNVMDSGRAYPLRLLATATSDDLPTIDGLATQHPVDARPAFWIDPALRTAAEQAGYEVAGAVDVVVGHLRQSVIRHASELLTRDATKKLLDQLRETSPAVVDELVPDLLSLGHVQQILQGLLDERVSIRNLPAILETLCDEATRSQSPEILIEHARRKLARAISSAYRDQNGQLVVATLASHWEQTLAGDDVLPSALNAQVISELCHDITIATTQLELQGHAPILLVPSALRSRLRRITRTELSNLVVISYAEVTASTQVESLAVAGEASGESRS